MASSKAQRCTLLPPAEHAFWHTPGYIDSVLDTVAGLEADADAQQSVLTDLAQENASLKFSSESTKRELQQTKNQLAQALEELAVAREQLQLRDRHNATLAQAVQSQAEHTATSASTPASTHATSEAVRPRRAVRDAQGYVAVNEPAEQNTSRGGLSAPSSHQQPAVLRPRRFVPSGSPLQRDSGASPEPQAAGSAAAQHSVQQVGGSMSDAPATSSDGADAGHQARGEEAMASHAASYEVPHDAQFQNRGGMPPLVAAALPPPGSGGGDVASVVAAAVAAATARAGATLSSLLPSAPRPQQSQQSADGSSVQTAQPTSSGGSTIAAPGPVLLTPAGVPPARASGSAQTAAAAMGTPNRVPVAPQSAPPSPLVAIPIVGWQRAAVDAAARAVKSVMPAALAGGQPDGNVASNSAGGGQPSSTGAAFYVQQDGLTAAERSAQRVAAFARMGVAQNIGGSSAAGGAQQSIQPAGQTSGVLGTGGQAQQGWAFAQPAAAAPVQQPQAGSAGPPLDGGNASAPASSRPPAMSLAQLYSAGSAPATPAKQTPMSQAPPPTPQPPIAVASSTAAPAAGAASVPASPGPASERLAALRERRAAATAREEQLRQALHAQLALVRQQAAAR
jgi:hypothetical protein